MSRAAMSRFAGNAEERRLRVQNHHSHIACPGTRACGQLPQCFVRPGGKVRNLRGNGTSRTAIVTRWKVRRGRESGGQAKERLRNVRRRTRKGGGEGASQIEYVAAHAGEAPSGLYTCKAHCITRSNLRSLAMV